MRCPALPLLLLVGLVSPMACAQPAAREPAPALEVPTRSRAATSHREVQAHVADAVDGRTAAAALAQGGEEAVAALAQLVNAGDQPMPRRVRAMELLATVEAPAAAKAIQAAAKDPQAPPALRAAAVVALAQRHGVRALAELKALLGDPADEVRVSAARGLAALATAEARTAIEERLGTETEREVREALQHALTRTHP